MDRGEVLSARVYEGCGGCRDDGRPLPHSRPPMSDEQARLDALRAYEILDTVPEPEYDDLPRLAAQIADTPMAVFTLVDEVRQWFKASAGLSIRETARCHSFCSHA